MIEKILMGIMKLIISLVSLLLAPIDLLLKNAIPDLSNAFTAIGNFFSIVSQSIGWCLSITGLSESTFALIVAYFVFKLTIPFQMYMIKLAISWYNKLKP